MTDEVTAYLGLGANLGDRERQIRAALEALDALPGVRVEAVSALRETAPVGGPPQGYYLNGAARLRTTLAPEVLLGLCKELERRAGRDPGGEPNGPRPLDLDLLLYGDQRIDRRGLQVPHPRMAQRAFVMEPLAELGVPDDAPVHWERPCVMHDGEELAATCGGWLRGDCNIGLVPTMGALHRGHASLVRTARRECDRVVVTVFVNPLQFGAGEDLDRYPRTLPADVELLAAEGTDLVYAPAADAVYPAGFCTRLSVGAEAEGMEGAVRDGHFEGVATIVAKLLGSVRPHVAYFGRKDAQQLAVIRRLVADLGLPVRVRACPTVREPDGLALSSRNAYLSAAERARATVLYRALSAARARFSAGIRDHDALVGAARDVLAAEAGVAVDYVEIRRDEDLAPLPPGPLLAGRMLIAARFGGTRLIDNMALDGADEVE